jgi:hypothetical protein
MYEKMLAGVFNKKINYAFCLLFVNGLMQKENTSQVNILLQSERKNSNCGADIHLSMGICYVLYGSSKNRKFRIANIPHFPYYSFLPCDKEIIFFSELRETFKMYSFMLEKLNLISWLHA